MIKYMYTITLEELQDSFTELIQVGNYILQFDFQWSVVTEEQGGYVLQYLRNRAMNDPILKSFGLDRSYSWYQFYIGLVNIDLGEWLNTNPELPLSLHKVSRGRQLELLNNRIAEVKTLRPAVTLYHEMLKWHFTMTSSELGTTVGCVLPGGWYRNKDANLAFRFTSALPTIGKDDITKVTIEFEVYDE